MVVAVDVAGRDGNRLGAGGECPGHGEAAQAIAEEDGDAVVGIVFVGSHQIELAVAIQIGRDDIVGGVIGVNVLGRLERSIAVAEENADSFVARMGEDAPLIRGGDIEFAVAVEVGVTIAWGALFSPPFGPTIKLGAATKLGRRPIFKALNSDVPDTRSRHGRDSELPDAERGCSSGSVRGKRA